MKNTMKQVKNDFFDEEVKDGAVEQHVHNVEEGYTEDVPGFIKNAERNKKLWFNIINLNFIVRLQFNSKYDTTSKDLRVQTTVSYSSLHS
jgi:hypothetical protein